MQEVRDKDSNGRILNKTDDRECSVKTAELYNSIQQPLVNKDFKHLKCDLSKLCAVKYIPDFQEYEKLAFRGRSLSSTQCYISM